LVQVVRQNTNEPGSDPRLLINILKKAFHDNHGRSPAAKKGTGEREVTKKVKGNPQLLLRVPPELQKPLADEATKTGETRQGVLWRIAAKYFKGRKA
jgi:hypothetical protein